MTTKQRITTLIATFVIGGVVGWIIKPCDCPEPYRYDGRVTPPSGSELIATGTDSVVTVSVTQRPATGSSYYAAPKRSRPRDTSETRPITGIVSTPPDYPPGSLSVDTHCSEAFEDEYEFVTDYRDSITVSVLFPERSARLARFVPAPDTVRTVTVTNDLIYEVPDKRRLGIGFHAGVGVAIDRTDGVQVHPGVTLGVGVNFNVWEP